MAFTRAQVNAAKQALGLDPDEVRSVTIYPDGVYVETVARGEDGLPLIRDGLVGYTRDTHDIEEEPSDG